jgi:putative ABC transport system permease protein
LLAHSVLGAFRSFRRGPAITAVNVLTLALGLVSFVVAFAVGDYWSSADRQLADAERTLAVTTRFRARDGAFDSGVRPLSSQSMAQYLGADFPQLSAVARVVLPKITSAEDSAVRAGDRTARARGLAADAAFLEIFDLPFVTGRARDALRAPGSVVLTKATAEALYGSSELALGSPIVVDNAVEGTVTGVLDAIPEPSHLGSSSFAPLRFDMLLSRDFADRIYFLQFGRELASQPENWVSGADTTYVLLPEDGSLTREELRRQLPAFLSRHVPAEQVRDFEIEVDVIPVSRLLGMAVSASIFPRQSSLSIGVVALVLGTLVLGVACANFANLATARAAVRAREIGVRKTLGASASAIALQYLLEVCALTFAALALAVGLAILAVPKIDAALDMRLGAVLVDSTPWLALALLLLGVTVVAGAYPALLLSRTAPMAAIRVGRVRAGPRFLGTWLVGAQFAVVAFLFIVLTVVYAQNRALLKSGAGLASAPVLVVHNDTSVTQLAQATLREELARLPGVTAATTMVTPPWTDPNGVLPFKATPSPTAPLSSALIYVVGEKFFDTLGIPLLAGRDFDSSRAADIAAFGRAPTGTQSVVISRALADELGATPSDIIGRQIYNPAGFAYEVIGVAENSVLSISADAGPRPRVYIFNPAALNFHVLRLSPDDVAGTVAAVDTLWKRLAPNVAIKRRFADEYFEQSYASFGRINQAFSVFAAVAAAIAAIGLAAIAVAAINRRRGEIGVRRVLGGTVMQIAVLLLTTFSTPVLIGNLIVWPLAYLAARSYLEVFIDPIDLTALPFVLSFCATLLVAGIAVTHQALTAARLKPAAVLRQE